MPQGLHSSPSHPNVLEHFHTGMKKATDANLKAWIDGKYRHHVKVKTIPELCYFTEYVTI